MRISAKQAAFLAAKIIFAVAVITWLFHKIDAHRVWLVVRDAHRLPIFFGLLLWLVTIVIAGWRWNQLLGILGIHVPVKSLTCVVPIAQFFSVFLPGSTGDDLTRMLYISALHQAALEKHALRCYWIVLSGLQAFSCWLFSAFPGNGRSCQFQVRRAG